MITLKYENHVVTYKRKYENYVVNQCQIAWNQILYYVQKGKFHVEMTKTTPNGSDTISADDGYVVSEVLTWKLLTSLCLWLYKFEETAKTLPITIYSCSQQ